MLRYVIVCMGDVTNLIFFVTVLVSLHCTKICLPLSYLATSAVQRHQFRHANEYVRDIQRFERGELNSFLCYWGKREDVDESGVPSYLLLFLF